MLIVLLLAFLPFSSKVVETHGEKKRMIETVEKTSSQEIAKLPNSLANDIISQLPVNKNNSDLEGTSHVEVTRRKHISSIFPPVRE